MLAQLDKPPVIRLVTNVVIDLSDWVRTHRLRAELTQEELAQRVGGSVGSISRYERGRHEPALEQFVRLCIEFRASADEALGLGAHVAPRESPRERKPASRARSAGAQRDGA